MSPTLEELTAGPRLFYAVSDEDGRVSDYLLIKDGYVHRITPPIGTWKPEHAWRLTPHKLVLDGEVARLASSPEFPGRVTIAHPDSPELHRLDWRKLTEVDVSTLGTLTWEKPKAGRPGFGRYIFTGAPPIPGENR